MPEYDYECKSCGKEFTMVLSMHEHEEQEKRKKIRCPKCDSKDVKHLVESVYVTTSRKS